MGATFSRLKNWIAENLTNENLNAEIDNILDNLTPAGTDDYSTNVTQMRLQTDPGEQSSESLATSLAGEVERIRFALKEITGKTYWYESPASNIETLQDFSANNTPNHRIVSAAVTSASDNMSNFLDPDGSAATVTVKAAATDLVYRISGTEYTLSADKAVTSLLTAPSSNNTALVNYADGVDQNSTKVLGMGTGAIPIDTIGSEISSLDGEYAAFSINNGSATEYFLAKVDNGNSQLIDVRRGYFFNSSQAGVDPIVFSNNDTITLLKLTWLYVDTNGDIAVNYNNPVYSGDQPSSPATGDYWFDLTNQVWKTFNGSVFSTVTHLPIGICAQDSSNCIIARSFDIHKFHTGENSLDLRRISNTVVHGMNSGVNVEVNGVTLRYTNDVPKWDIASNLESGVSETASTVYYLYLDEFGDEFISDIAPLTGKRELKGLYHPHHMWRAVGEFYNDNSSNIVNVFPYAESHSLKRSPIVSVTTQYVVMGHEEIILCDSSGGAFAIEMPLASQFSGRKLIIKKTTNDFTAVTIVLNGATNTTLNILGETLTLISDGSTWTTLNRVTETGPHNYTPVFVGFGTVTSIAADWARNGKYLYINCKFITGTPTAVEASVSIPSGLNMVVNSNISGGLPVGEMYRGATLDEMRTVLASEAASSFGFGGQTISNFSFNNGDALLSATETTSFWAKVAISGWKGNND